MSKQTPVSEILAADLCALKKRALAGTPLTAAQRRALEKIGEPQTGQASGFASTLSGLATALQCTRQLIAYHRRKPDSPRPRLDGRHSIAEWTDYLAIASRVVMGQSQPVEAGPTEAEVFAEGREDALLAIGERLPDALAAAAELALLTPDAGQLDVLVFVCWKAFCEILKTEPAAEDVPAEIADAKRRLEAIAAGS